MYRLTMGSDLRTVCAMIARSDTSAIAGPDRSECPAYFSASNLAARAQRLTTSATDWSSAACRPHSNDDRPAEDSLTLQIKPLRAQLQTIGAHQPGVLALTQQYGIGLLCGTIIWAELGDCRRFSNSDQAVRFAGLDVTVWSSDTKRSAGRLARQGSPELRWALFEAAKSAARQTSPDHDYYQAVRDRLGGKRPALSVARKLARRCYHALRDLGDQAWQASIAAPSQEQQPDSRHDHQCARPPTSTDVRGWLPPPSCCRPAGRASRKE